MNRNIVIAAALTTCAVLGIGNVWYHAPARHAELQSASEQFTPAPAPTSPPHSVTQIWETKDTSVGARPVNIDGIVVAASKSTVTAMDPSTGETIWTYARDLDVCSLAAAFSHGGGNVSQ